MGSCGSAVSNLHARNILARLPPLPLRAMRLLPPYAACDSDGGPLGDDQKEGKR
jgi:hypothetical protein